MKKESLSISTARLVMSINLIVGIGVILGVMGYILKVNNEFFINSAQQTEMSAKSFIDESEKKNLKILEDPPEEIRAIYLTAFSAGNSSKMDSFIDLIEKENFNAVVVDIKDATGNIAYDVNVEDVDKYDAKYVKIDQIDELIEKLHSNDIYVIARIVVFEDPIVAKKRPDLAIKNKVTGGLWENYGGIEWIDPASTEYWDYIVKIAKEASNRGFDEINFDYIRFPSDGPLRQMSFPFYDSEKRSKREVMKEVFEHFRLNLSDIPISVDLFGLATINDGDLGIGQTIEDTFENFDYICPMVYPSHYANGFIGFQNPAQYPYEVVKYSIEHAYDRLETYRTASQEDTEGQNKPLAKIRPWLQAFDIGAVYGPDMIKAQIDANNEAGGVGWILWNASNNYSSRIAGIND